MGPLWYQNIDINHEDNVIFYIDATTNHEALHLERTQRIAAIAVRVLFTGSLTTPDGNKIRCVYTGEEPAEDIVFVNLEDIRGICPTMQKYFDTMRNLARKEIGVEYPAWPHLGYYDMEKEWIWSRAYLEEIVHLPNHFWFRVQNSDTYAHISNIMRSRRNSITIETNIIPSLSNSEEFPHQNSEVAVRICQMSFRISIRTPNRLQVFIRRTLEIIFLKI